MTSRLRITDNATQGRLELVESDTGWGLGWVFYALALCTLSCGGLAVLGLSEKDWNNAFLTGFTALGVGWLTSVAAQSYRDVHSEPRLYVALTPEGLEYESHTKQHRHRRHEFQFVQVERTEAPRPNARADQLFPCLKLWLAVNPRGPSPGTDSGWLPLMSHVVDVWSDREEQQFHLLRQAIVRMGLHECPPGFVAPPEDESPAVVASSDKKRRRRKKKRRWG
jgi:hypothetical protein